MFDKLYYQNKKQNLIRRNQKLSQEHLQNSLNFAREIFEMEQEFQEITKWEQEQLAKEKKNEKVPTKSK